jgi:hypothetical protein
LCVAPNMLNTCSFRSFACIHNAILDMFCHECSQIVIIGTLCFDCAHICDFELNCANRIHYHMEILPHVFLPNSPLIA